MYSSSDTTRASLPMQMPHPSLFLLLLLLFILIVWNNAASYIPLVIYYIAQGQTFIAQNMCVDGSERVSKPSVGPVIYLFFLIAARACHRLTTVTSQSLCAHRKELNGTQPGESGCRISKLGILCLNHYCAPTKHSKMISFRETYFSENF